MNASRRRRRRSRRAGGRRGGPAGSAGSGRRVQVDGREPVSVDARAVGGRSGLHRGRSEAYVVQLRAAPGRSATGTSSGSSSAAFGRECVMVMLRVGRCFLLLLLVFLFRELLQPKLLELLQLEAFLLLLRLLVRVVVVVLLVQVAEHLLRQARRRARRRRELALRGLAELRQATPHVRCVCCAGAGRLLLSFPVALEREKEGVEGER